MTMNFIWDVIHNTAFLWIPIFLGIVFWHVRKEWYKQYFLSKQKYTMLEINISRNIERSPQAMEFVIDMLHQLGGGAMSWMHRFWLGSVLLPASLEIASIEGSIYFFIRVNTKFKDSLTSTIYSQFPDVQVNEVDDYTRYIGDYTKKENLWNLYGADFKLALDDAYPIKTYVDYGLDKAVGSLEEEQKIDPITPSLEFLSSLGPGEQIWIQYVLRADSFSDWRKRAQTEVENILKKAQVVPDPEEGTPTSQNLKLTHGDQEKIKSIERSLGKAAFECIIRGLYVSRKQDTKTPPKGFFKSDIFKPFNSMYFNAIRKNSDTDQDWVWQDLSGKKFRDMKRGMFQYYVNREAFYEPFWTKDKLKPFVLTTEELATLFHFPGRVAQTTTLGRIETKKTEPPANLPI